MIRSATAEDLEQLQRLSRAYDEERRGMLAPDFQCLEGPTPAEALSKWIGDERFRCFVAESDACIVGFIVCHVREIQIPSGAHEREGRVSDLFVHKDHRRRGVASQLYLVARGWFAQQGCHWEGLTVYATNPAQTLYQEWGYQPYSINMRKRIQ